MGDYEIKDIYQGGPSTFKPYNTSKYFPISKMGETTNPRSINIIKEVSDRLSSGTKHVEVEGVTPEIFDAIPKQFFEEVHRLSKLTGINVSVHGPVINVSGLDQRGGYSDAEREIAEKKVASALIRSHAINPNGNVPVNFHSGEGLPSSEWLPPEKQTEENKARKLLVVNKESGRITPLETDIKYYPGGPEGKIREEIHTPEKNLDILNVTEWDNSISQLLFNKERADEILMENRPLIQEMLPHLAKKDFKPEDMPKVQQDVYKKVLLANAYLEDVNKQVNSLFSKAYEYGDDKQKRELMELSREFRHNLESSKGDIFAHSKAMQDLMFNMKERDLAPRVNVPLEEFATEKTAQTFGNAAFESYKKFKDKSATLVIENPPAGFVLSRGEDVKNVVVGARKEFVKKAVESGKLSKEEAEAAAKKLIGATWDVGHINMMRKYGWSEKDIIKETEKIAPYIKHVHLSDNFGLEHTELPMGMGNVPLKEMMEKLGKKGEEAAKIIEAGQWWNEFRSSPFHTAIQEIGSPIYNTRVAPYWNQAPGFHQDYFGGYGLMLPQVNYETFGAGFSALPGELGGQRQSAAQGSRMSGRGME